MRLFFILLAMFFISAQKNAYADCASPYGVTGQLTYNSTHNVFQGCRADGQWVALSGGNAIVDNLGDHKATANLIMDGHKITGLGTPTAGADAVSMSYADTKISKSGDTMTGNLVVSPPAYLSFGSGIGNKITWWGNQFGTGVEQDTLTHWANHHHRWRLGGTSVSTGTEAMILSNSVLDVKSKKITGLAAPTADTDAATKKYVDDAVSGGGGGILNCEVVNASITSGTGIRSASVTCASGRTVTGGGTNCTSSQALAGSYPITDGWHGRCGSGSGGAVYAVCCQAGDPPACDGVLIGSGCWYFGNNNQSCDQVCASRGGCNIAATRSIGSGGTDSACWNVLDALGAGSGNVTETNSGVDSGCYVYTGGTRYRDNANTTCAGKYSAGRRACACNN